MLLLRTMHKENAALFARPESRRGRPPFLAAILRYFPSMRRLSAVTPAILTALVLAGCGDDAGSAALPQPLAAPPCPPGVERVTDVAQVGDADRDNGRVRPDFGRLPAAAPFAGDPAAPGPFAVVRTEVAAPRPLGDTGTSAGTVYAADAARGAPLVVVLPGYGARHTGYAAYSELFASHGFVVLGLDTTDGGFGAASDHALEAARVVAAIEWMLGGSPWAARLDATKVAVAGHSKGGKLGYWAAALDPRIDLVVGWDPSNSGGAPCAIDPANCNAQPAAPNCNTPDGAGTGVLHEINAETVTIGVPPDRLTNPDPAHNALHFYRGAPGPATYYGLNGRHSDFLVGNAALQTLTRRITAAALLQRFAGRTIAADYLPGGSAFDPAGLLPGPPRTK